jgi:hypothetical protein
LLRRPKPPTKTSAGSSQSQILTSRWVLRTTMKPTCETWRNRRQKSQNNACAPRRHLSPSHERGIQRRRKSDRPQVTGRPQVLGRPDVACAAKQLVAKKEPPERGRFEELLDVRTAAFCHPRATLMRLTRVDFLRVGRSLRKRQICSLDDVS